MALGNKPGEVSIGLLWEDSRGKGANSLENTIASTPSRSEGEEGRGGTSIQRSSSSQLQ